jgi:hypothetical protein
LNIFQEKRIGARVLFRESFTGLFDSPAALENPLTFVIPEKLFAYDYKTRAGSAFTHFIILSVQTSCQDSQPAAITFFFGFASAEESITNYMLVARRV